MGSDLQRWLTPFPRSTRDDGEKPAAWWSRGNLPFSGTGSFSLRARLHFKWPRSDLSSERTRSLRLPAALRFRISISARQSRARVHELTCTSRNLKEPLECLRVSPLLFVVQDSLVLRSLCVCHGDVFVLGGLWTCGPTCATRVGPSLGKPGLYRAVLQSEKRKE